MNLPDLPKPGALSEWAYRAIKDEVLHLRIPPGRQLRIEELASQLGISRTPVREALFKLERDGLVQIVPRVGFYVSELTQHDLRELFELREILESRAAERAAQNLTESELEHLQELLVEGTAAVEQGNLARYLEIDIEFHNQLIQHADNRHLIAMMESVRDLTFRERVFSLRSPGNVRATLAEHRSILAALQHRDGTLAGQLMAQHLRAASERLQHV